MDNTKTFYRGGKFTFVSEDKQYSKYYIIQNVFNEVYLTVTMRRANLHHTHHTKTDHTQQ